MSAIQFTGLSLLSHDRYNQPLDTCTSLAAHAVLLALARSDRELNHAEAAAIVEFCARAFSLSASQRQDLLRAAKHLIDEPGNIEEACRLLRADLSTQQREGIANQLHTIMQADGKVTREEQRLYQRILSQLELVPQRHPSTPAAD